MHKYYSYEKEINVAKVKEMQFTFGQNQILNFSSNLPSFGRNDFFEFFCHFEKVVLE